MTAVPPGPINKAPGGCSPRDVLAAVLHEPLADIELGTYDERILTWLAGWDDPTVMTIASLLHRARATQPLTADVDTVTISRSEFNRLTEADDELGALHAAGVDNWEGYGEAMRS